MITFEEFLIEKEVCSMISPKQLEDLEKFGDRLLDKYGIDIEFTRHFGDRMSDARNEPCIKVTEIQALFKKIQKDHGEKIKSIHGEKEAVLVDIQKDLNLPFVIGSTGDGELVVRFKTIMRKKNFGTPDKKVNY